MDIKEMIALYRAAQPAKASLWDFLPPIFLNKIMFPTPSNNWEIKSKAWSHELRKNTLKKRNKQRSVTQNNKQSTEGREAIFLCLINSKFLVSKFFEVLVRTY